MNIICSNPPYISLDKVIEKSIDLEPKVTQYSIGINNPTAKRIHYFKNNGYSSKRIHKCKVFKWFGFGVIVQFEKKKKVQTIITYDRIVLR